MQRGALRRQLAAGVTNNHEQRLTRQARCENSWQRRTSNDEQRGSSGTALGTICAANTTGSGAQATRLAPRAQWTARIAVNNSSKQRPHATYLNHTRRVSWQLHWRRPTPKSRLIFRADIGVKINGFSLVICFFFSFLSCSCFLVYALGRMSWRSSFLACCLDMRSLHQPRTSLVPPLL